MSINTISNGTTTVFAGTDGEFWLLDANVNRNVAGGTGFDTNTFDDLTLSIAGTLTGAKGLVQFIGSTRLSVVIEDTGTVSGANRGLELRGDDSLLVNHGTIESTAFGSAGIYLTAASDGISVLNTGVISSASLGVVMYGTNHSVVNSGTITSDNLAAVVLGQGTVGSSVVNSGTLVGVDYGVLFDNTIGPASLFNSGTITGTFSVAGDYRAQTIINTGVLNGEVHLYGGKDFLDSTDGVINGTIDAGDGHDMVLTGAGSQVIDGGTGRDFVDAGAGGDTVSGGTGNDVLNGRAGKDTLNGNSGHDILRGGGGNDQIKGGGGQDLVIGGTGNDKLFGGGGIDVFKFAATDGKDKIMDYADGTDLIDLSAVGIASFAALTAAISNNNGNAIIDLNILGGTGVIRVIDAAGDMSVGDFIL